MTAIDRDRARAAFKSYTDAYDATNPRIALKIEHTYHVAEACDAVAREQGWSSEDIDLAWLCGLLHDMGRFEQLRRWDTFKDAESMSHAVLGIEVLFGENPADAPAVMSIRDFIDDPAEDELIRASIAYHSDFRLPAQLDERTRSFCDIVRDGDKIDIMRTIADSTVDTVLKVDEDTFLASHFSTPVISTACSTSGMVSARGNTGWCAPAMAAPAHKVLTLKAGTTAHRFSRKCSSPCFLPFWSILRYFGAGTGFLW